MSDRDTVHQPVRRPSLGRLEKSIFPTFRVNVPMPSDTAVPGSYKPEEQSSDNATTSAETGKGSEPT